MKKSRKDVMIELLIFSIVSFCLLFLFSVSTSSLYLSSGSESAVYKIMGKAILNGRIPYVDIYDNSAPLIYYINTIGIWLNPSFGLFLLQVIAMTFSFYFIYNTVRLFTTKSYSVTIMTVLSLLIIAMIQEGNSCEEWSLPFISFCLYLAMRYEKNQDIPNNINAYLCGLCFGIVLFLRVGCAIVIAGIAIGYILIYIHRGNMKKLRRYIVGFIIGAMTLSFPFAIWFYSIGALPGLLKAMFSVNDINIGVLNNSSFHMSLFKSVILYGGGIFVAFYIIFKNVYIDRNFSRRLGYILLPVALAVLFSVIFSAARSHFYLTFLPIISIGMAIAFKTCSLKYRSAFAAVVMLPFTLPFISKLSTTSLLVIKYTQLNREYCNQLENLIEEIPKVERNDIYNYNLRNEGLTFFTYNNITPCNRFLVRDKYVSTGTQLFSDCFYDPLWVVCEESSDEENSLLDDYDIISAINIHNDHACMSIPKRIAIYRRTDSKGYMTLK